MNKFILYSVVLLLSSIGKLCHAQGSISPFLNIYDPEVESAQYSFGNVFVELESSSEFSASSPLLQPEEIEAVITDVPEVEIPQLSAFPNPVNDVLFLDGNEFSATSQYQIFDAESSLVQEGTIENQTISMASLSPGVYHLALKQENNSIQYIKIIKL